MNNDLLLIGILQFFIVITISILVFYLILRILEKSILKKFEIDINTTAFGILAASIIVSTGYMASGITSSISNTIRLLNNDKIMSFETIFETSQYTMMYLVMALAASHIVIWSSLKVFTVLTTKIDEFAEIKKNNLSIAFISSAIIIAVSFMAKDSIDLLIESMVPYPQLNVPTNL